MNKERRKELEEIHETLGNLILQVEELHDAEEEAFSNLPESLQETERGAAMETAMDMLENLQNFLEDAADCCEEITNG